MEKGYQGGTMGAIRINQMGYRKESTKQVVYVGEASEFLIFDIGNDQLIYEGKLNPPIFDEASKEVVCTGDFSSLRHQGNYCLQIGNESVVFKISDSTTQICTDALQKAFYYQRCGVELTHDYAGVWQHKACHLQNSYVFHPEAETMLEHSPEAMELIDTKGGWHDAGDYGRYTIAAAKAVADLMMAYEHYPNAFDHPIHIPESALEGNDLLQEVKVELDFLLKMQRQSDGSVYTKVATRYFPPMIMPEEDTDPLFIFDISSPATGSFAAVMAMAGRIYEAFDQEYANKCLVAAKKAYQWLSTHSEYLFQNPPDILSGEYGDHSDLDERYWAAAELYKTTGEKEYHEDFLRYYEALEDKFTLGWATVSGYGTISYLTCERDHDKVIYETLKNDWLARGEELAKRSQEDGYGITLSLDEYIWGSTMVLLNQGIHLIIANKLRMNNQYDYMIERNWDYIFGMNPMDISYVTGLGERSVMAPHHRPSEGDGVMEPVPGLLSGGPVLWMKQQGNTCKGNHRQNVLWIW